MKQAKSRSDMAQLEREESVDMMSDRVRFGELLKRYRVEAEFTQAELARLAGIGLDTIGALERGVNNCPRKSTVERLSEALDLCEAERAEFEAYARPHPRAKRRVVIRGSGLYCAECPYHSTAAPALRGM